MNITKSYIRFPKTRAGCSEIPRPCPFIRCRYHMLWVMLEGGCKYNHKYRHLAGDPLARFSDREILKMIFSMPETCVLDVADEGFHTLQEIADLLDLSYQRIHSMANGIGQTRGFIKKMREAMDEEDKPIIATPYRKTVNSVPL